MGCYPIRYIGLLRLLTAFFAIALAAARGQGNYEVQVYGSDLVPPHNTMVELHSNFTVQGSKTIIDGMLPTEHQEHETLEITHGWSEWFETGLYQFTDHQPGGGWMWVGTHIRPRVAVPERYHLPVGISLSTEIGYQRAIFSADTWTWEIRPIIDKKLGRWYSAFNPSLDRAFHGPDTRFDPLRDQQQQIVPAIDLNLNPKWEFNFGVGVGITHGTDHLLVKMILGYRLSR